MADPATTFSYIKWLRHLAQHGKNGTVDNIDARALGRIADRLEKLQGVSYD